MIFVFYGFELKNLLKQVENLDSQEGLEVTFL